MRICIPTTDDAGLRGRLSPHFGRAPWFTIVDVEAGRAWTLRNRRAQHEAGRCDPVAALEGETVDAVVCRGMGPSARDELRSRGVAVLVTGGWTVADAVRELREGTLSPLTAERAGRHVHG
jgi:predicted Fe-Mo cluster-binding NifX family protein